MLETQRYKVGKEFTLPAEGADIVRGLIADRLVTVAAALDDPNAPKCFTPREMTAIAFERLMLAKMLAKMSKEAVHA